MHARDRPRRRDPAVLTQLEADLRRVLGDVRHAVAGLAGDARQGSARCAAELHAGVGSVPAEQQPRREAFLAWVGRRSLHPARLQCSYAARGQRPTECSSGASRARASASCEPRTMAPCRRASRPCPAEMRGRATATSAALTITKANTRSTVHRGTYLDFIGVKRFAADGSVIGEHRFLGSADIGRLQHEPAPDSADRPEGRADRRARRLPADRACRQGIAATSWRPIRATSCCRPPRRSCSRS